MSETISSSGLASQKNLQVIWSLTRNCPLKCRQCAVNADHQQSSPPDWVIMEVAANVAGLNRASFDLSGGDPLYQNADYAMTKRVVSILGPERCSVSTTGVNLDDARMDLLANMAGADFTLDESPGSHIEARPRGCTTAAMRGIRLCSAQGTPVSVFTVLTHWTATVENLSGIQLFLDRHGVDQWVWLPLYPVGRASMMDAKAFSYPEPEELISHLPGKTEPKLQHTLVANGTCHAGQDVVYISTDGKLSACPWAVLPNGQPHPEFVLGDLLEEDIEEILTHPWTAPCCPAQFQQGLSAMA